MKENIFLALFRGEEMIDLRKCLAFSLEREIYTPFESITAEFLSEKEDYSGIDHLEVYAEEECIFCGLIDNFRKFKKENVSFVKIHSKSFTSLLTQNELPSGLHSNLTMHDLMTKFYTFPYITFDNPETTEYIFVKSGNTMWDGIVSFCYKITGNYPYILHNHICFSPENQLPALVYSPETVSEFGSGIDTTKIISHYHMEDLAGQLDIYQKINPYAEQFQIVRHKQIQYDRSFTHAPEDALTFRNLYSCRGMQFDYFIYNGFQNELLGQSVQLENIFPASTLCRIQTTFGGNGFQTKLSCYHDGFYA